VVRVVVFLAGIQEAGYDEIVPFTANRSFPPSDILAMVRGNQPLNRQLARGLVGGGEWEKARDGYLSALGPDDTLFLPEAALALNETGRGKEAADDLRRRLVREPRDAEAWYALALVGANTARLPWEEVEGAFLRAIDLAPLETRYRIRYSGELLDRRLWEKASAQLTLAVGLAPGDAWLRYNLGRAQEGLGRTEEARRAYSAAVNLAPTVPEYRTALDRTR
jgi:tetratricopeptide (TPR) repeat protein